MVRNERNDMKYRLKKDLPFAKAGTEVYDDRYSYITVKNLITKDGGSFFIGYDIKELLTTGWIEEVKPREWHISESNLEYFNKMYKEDYYPEINYIKVREVI